MGTGHRGQGVVGVVMVVAVAGVAAAYVSSDVMFGPPMRAVAKALHVCNTC